MVYGMICLCPLVTCEVNDWLKSPLRSAWFGSDANPPCGFLLRKPSYSMKQNVFRFPLYSFGIQTGPPNVNPHWLRRIGGLTALVRFRLNWRAFRKLF